jgi:DNA-binding CsgD family transcriptional regulator
MTVKPTYEELEQKVKGLKKMAIDLRDMKTALKESEEKYISLFEMIPSSIVMIDEKGRVIDVNPFHMTHIAKRSIRKEEFTIHNMLTHPTIVNAGLIEIYQKLLEGEPFDKKGVYFPTTIMGDDAFCNVRGVPLFREGKIVGAITIFEDITELVKTQEELKKTRNELERRVEDRTAMLKHSNVQLTKEIEERKQAELALRESKNQLKTKAHDLQEANTALKVLLKHIEEDRKEIEEKVLANVKQLVDPYIEELKKSRMNSIQETYLGILQSNLNEVTSPFTRKLSSEYVRLTPAEIRVANLVRYGKTTKEIAELLKISIKTIGIHRENIRKKLGSNNKYVSH